MDIRLCCVCGHEVTDRPGFMCGTCENDQKFLDQMLDELFPDIREEDEDVCIP
jgi:hypothetical protein